MLILQKIKIQRESLCHIILVFFSQIQFWSSTTIYHSILLKAFVIFIQFFPHWQIRFGSRLYQLEGRFTTQWTFTRYIPRAHPVQLTSKGGQICFPFSRKPVLQTLFNLYNTYPLLRRIIPRQIFVLKNWDYCSGEFGFLSLSERFRATSNPPTFRWYRCTGTKQTLCKQRVSYTSSSAFILSTRIDCIVFILLIPIHFSVVTLHSNSFVGIKSGSRRLHPGCPHEALRRDTLRRACKLTNKTFILVTSLM